MQSSAFILRLPLELLYLVSSYSTSCRDVSRLARCNKQLYRSLNTFLYRSNMRGSEQSALMWASIHGRPRTAQKVFELCGDMEIPVASLQEALAQAIQECSWGVMKVLLANGTDANTQGKGFGHVLQAASWKGDMDLVQLVLAKGADVNALAGHYGTALIAAAWNGHECVADLLISKGAHVNAQGGNYGNALQAASSTGHRNTVKLLIRHGAVPNAIGGFYGTALQAACWQGDHQVVESLLQAGADASTRGRECETAFSLASRGGHISAVWLLFTWSIRKFMTRKLTIRTSKEAC
jgi:hypothetical protein